MNKREVCFLCIVVICVTGIGITGVLACDAKILPTQEQRIIDLEARVLKLETKIARALRSMTSTKLVPNYSETRTVKRGVVNPYSPYPSTYHKYQYNNYTRRYHPEQEARNDYESRHGGDQVKR